MWPTPEEMARLLELAKQYGVILATIEDPTLTESQRHSLATKAGGKAGRPSSITGENALGILDMLEWGEGSLQSVADFFATEGHGAALLGRMEGLPKPDERIPGGTQAGRAEPRWQTSRRIETAVGGPRCPASAVSKRT